MRLVQIPECGGFDLEFADRLRKSIAKKNPAEYKKLTEEYFTSTKEKGLSKNLCNYVWNILIAMNRGYGFNAAHTLAYSIVGLQEMNLAYKFPIIYWNTACLISNSGGEGDSTDYAKIARSVNKTREAGIEVSLVDINKSELGFIPDVENNRILFGLKGLVNVGDDLIHTIIENRPYVSLVDFYNRIKPNCQAMISLIKGGAFDQFCSRMEAMIQYLWLTCDKKKRLTLQNMSGLIRYNLIPDGENYTIARRVYEFNRYLKAECKGIDKFILTDRAIDFLNEIDKSSLVCFYTINPTMDIKEWDKVYQSYMDIFRQWIKKNTESILSQLNTIIFMESWEKYAKGNISSWEMEALCFYYHEHELKNVDNLKYGFSDFFKLSKEPIVEKVFKRGNSNIPIYKLNKICGTCIAKDKSKNTVDLLTPTGVVSVKFRREYFALFDSQISRKNDDGTKTIVERSWFNRGQMIVVQGMRRGDEFVAKRYASSNSHQLYKIDQVNSNGTLILRSERKQGNEIEEI